MKNQAGEPAVIEALEQGEVRTLLWAAPRTLSSVSRSRGSPAPEGNGATQSASLCPHCGHLESRPVNACGLCGTQMHRFGRAEEALLRHALGRNLEARMLTYATLPPPDEIVAWLRFNARRNTAQALAS
jgi:hypothetical protein